MTTTYHEPLEGFGVINKAGLKDAGTEDAQRLEPQPKTLRILSTSLHPLRMYQLFLAVSFAGLVGVRQSF
jgi:hypothetical protein